MIKSALRLLGVAGFVLLAGCAGIKEAGTKIDNVKAAAVKARDTALANATTGSGTRTKRPRYTGEEITLRTSNWPEAFDQPDWYNTKGSQSLVQVLEDIAATRGISIKTAQVAQLIQQAQQGAIGQQSPAGGVGPTNINIDYNGTRRGLLEAIGAKADLSCRYNEVTHAVEFFRFETRSIQLVLPSSKKTISANISLSGVTGGGGGDSGGGGGGGSASATSGNVSVTQNNTVDPWTSVMQGIGTILNSQMAGGAGGGAQPASGGQGDGASLSVSSANGYAVANKDLNMVTVTARPEMVEAIVHYIESINAKYSQNVQVDWTIYSLSLDRQSSGGITLNMLRSQVAKIGGSLITPAGLQAGNPPGIFTIAKQAPDSPWTGSSLVFEALSQFGDAALMRQGQVMTVNGQPSPIQVANQISYKSSQTVNVVANAGVTKATTQSQIVVGLTGFFLPQVLEDNRIRLTYALNLSNLASPLTPDADGLSSPNVAAQSLQQDVFLRDGQTVVLFGYDEQRDSLNSATTVGGYSKAGESARQMVVIVMQINAGAKDEAI